MRLPKPIHLASDLLTTLQHQLTGWSSKPDASARQQRIDFQPHAIGFLRGVAYGLIAGRERGPRQTFFRDEAVDLKLRA